MKRLTYLFLFIALLPAWVQAQQNKRVEAAKEKIEAAKIGFFSQQMELTPAEAKQFWPEYELYQNRLENLKTARRQSQQRIGKNVEMMSDQEINQLIDSRLGQANEAVKAREDFINAIRKFLPPLKVVRYFAAEEQFKKKLMERLEQRKQQAERPNRRFRN